MLLKCCSQYVRKFGKLSSGHRIGKCQLSFQSQRRAKPKYVQITIQLRSFHMLAMWCSKSFKLGGTSGKETACQRWSCKRCKFDPWVREDPLEKEMTTHSSILAWEIPWTEELNGSQFMGWQKFRDHWSDLAQHTGLSSMWTENFQMYKLSFQEAEELEIKLPTFVGS